ncbi:hypothetical protein K440DRAFT_688287 [Wilcoxina mikolae CBS 423.85]|nr:hypothetical protein K440DRAFT_688287 [Wilcoxina mikolae CBS 423.85]
MRSNFERSNAMATTYIIFMIILSYLVPAALADQGDDFSNNLFNDLAPLIALFGEQVAKQYLSQSIITAITCAIRVGGSKPLRAIIGRAREPDAQAEIEVMSCGVGIVRVPGSPDIIELLYDTENAGVPENEDDMLPNIVRHHVGVYELQDVMKSGEADDDDLEHSRLLKAEAPNISLNTSDSTARAWELRTMALLAILLQSDVLVFDGVVMYQLGWRKQGQTQRAANYSFPCALVGTLAIVAGMFICAYVIEASTEEHTWKLKGLKKDLQIVWLQRDQTVNDQRFKSYGIYAAKNRKDIKTSRPLKKKGTFHSLTNISVGISISSFVLQFVGLRGMHFSASLAQLIATFLMTIIRVFLRRNLASEPIIYGPNETPSFSAEQYSVQELPEGHELELIAKQMVGCKSWNIVTNQRQTSGSAGVFGVAEIVPREEYLVAAGRTLQARIRLSEIGGLKVSAATENGRGVGFLDFEINRTPIENRMTPWKTKEAVIEAALCLWMSHLHQLQPAIQDDGNNLWLSNISGDKDGNLGRVLYDWWIAREVDSINVAMHDFNYNDPNIAITDHVHQIRDICEIHSIQESRVLDCITGTPTSNSLVLQGVINKTPLSEMCAQYILSSFVTTIAKYIPPVSVENTKVKAIESRRLLKVVNDDLENLAHIIQRSGLATFDDAYRIIVPALFEANKLPDLLNTNLQILDLSKKFHDESGNDDHMSEVCSRIRSIWVNQNNAMIAHHFKWSEAGERYRELENTFVKTLGSGTQ